MSVAVPVIDYIDGSARRVYLRQGVDSFHWIEDVYREYVNMRSNDEALRKWSPFMRAAGNDAKGLGKYTPRYVTLLNGCRVIPYDENIAIYITGEAITDNPETDPDPFDTSTRVNPLKLFITPPAAEIVRDEESLAAIAYMSFGSPASVSVNINSGYNIANFTDASPDLLGNNKYPVDNILDAVTIANNKKISRLELHSSLIGANSVGVGVVLDDFTIVGRSAVNIKLEVLPAAECSRVSIEDCDFTGTLDGGTHLVHCYIGDMDYVNGHIEGCGLYGNIVLAGGKEAIFNNCTLVDQDQTPSIDMGGGGQDLVMPNYTGKIIIGNLTSSTEEISVGLNAGIIILESSITAGNIIVSGIGILQDNTTGTAHVNNDGLMNRELIAKTTWDQVVYDSAGLEVGTKFPVGTTNHPVNNLADLKTICVENHIHRIKLHSSIVLTESINNFMVEGEKHYTVDLNGQSILGASFEFAIITGNQANPAKFDRCQIHDVVGLCGSYKECVFPDDTPMSLCSGHPVVLLDCATAMEGLGALTFDLSCGGIDLQIKRYSGGLRVINSNDLTNTIGASILGGKVILDATCLQGSCYLGGMFGLDDSSASNFIVNLDSKAASAEDNAEATWAYTQ